MNERLGDGKAGWPVSSRGAEAFRERSPAHAGANARSVLVVGFGNDLVGDDGCGLAVVERLRERAPASGLRLERGHSDSLRLATLWRGEPEVWLVDALVRGAAPGSVHRLEHEELVAIPQRHATAHRLSLPESLRWMTHAYPEMTRVRYRLWGIEPGRLALGEGLSGEVERAVEAVVGEILCAAGPGTGRVIY